MEVPSTIAYRVNTMDRPPTSSYRNLSKRSLNPSVNGQNFASVGLCRQMLANLVKCNEALTYRYLCRGKKQSFFALLPKLAQHFVVMPALKVFEAAHLFLLPLLKVSTIFNPSRVWF